MTAFCGVSLVAHDGRGLLTRCAKFRQRLADRREEPHDFGVQLKNVAVLVMAGVPAVGVAVEAPSR